MSSPDTEFLHISAKGPILYLYSYFCLSYNSRFTGKEIYCKMHSLFLTDTSLRFYLCMNALSRKCYKPVFRTESTWYSRKTITTTITTKLTAKNMWVLILFLQNFFAHHDRVDLLNVNTFLLFSFCLTLERLSSKLKWYSGRTWN